MLTGRGSHWMRHDLSGGAGEEPAARHAPHLAALDGTEAVDEARPHGEPVEPGA